MRAKAAEVGGENERAFVSLNLISADLLLFFPLTIASTITHTHMYIQTQINTYAPPLIGSLLQDAVWQQRLDEYQARKDKHSKDVKVHTI